MAEDLDGKRIDEAFGFRHFAPIYILAAFIFIFQGLMLAGSPTNSAKKFFLLQINGTRVGYTGICGQNGACMQSVGSSAISLARVFSLPESVLSELLGVQEALSYSVPVVACTFLGLGLILITVLLFVDRDVQNADLINSQRTRKRFLLIFSIMASFWISTTMAWTAAYAAQVVIDAVTIMNPAERISRGMLVHGFLWVIFTFSLILSVIARAIISVDFLSALFGWKSRHAGRGDGQDFENGIQGRRNGRVMGGKDNPILDNDDDRSFGTVPDDGDGEIITEHANNRGPGSVTSDPFTDQDDAESSNELTQPDKDQDDQEDSNKPANVAGSQVDENASEAPDNSDPIEDDGNTPEEDKGFQNEESYKADVEQDDENGQTDVSDENSSKAPENSLPKEDDDKGSQDDPVSDKTGANEETEKSDDGEDDENDTEQVEDSQGDTKENASDNAGSKNDENSPPAVEKDDPKPPAEAGGTEGWEAQAAENPPPADGKEGTKSPSTNNGNDGW